jgi:hypothetical protein
MEIAGRRRHDRERRLIPPLILDFGGLREALPRERLLLGPLGTLR